MMNDYSVLARWGGLAGGTGLKGASFFTTSSSTFKLTIIKYNLHLQIYNMSYLNIFATKVPYFRISGFCTNWSQRHTDWVLSQDTLIFIKINSQQHTHLYWVSQDQSPRGQPWRCHTPSSLPLVLLGFKEKSQKVHIQCENNIKA